MTLNSSREICISNPYLSVVVYVKVLQQVVVDVLRNVGAQLLTDFLHAELAALVLGGRGSTLSM